MAKKIKFALDMANGIKARTLDDLRSNFSLEKAIGYYINGKLLEWLEDRYYDSEVAAIRKLNSSDRDIKKRLCQALGVEYSETETDIDLEIIESINHKKSKLKQLTADKAIIANADKTAFTQEDLAALLAENCRLIYLCGKEFSIPINASGYHYIGIIDKPQVYINAHSLAEIAEADIIFENVRLADHLQEKIVEEPAVKRKSLSYQPSALFDFMLDKNDRVKTEQLFYAVQEGFKNSKFYIEY